MYGSLINTLIEAPSIGSLETPGFNTVNCSTSEEGQILELMPRTEWFLLPSNRPNDARTRNGAALPTYSYMNPPNGGPTRIHENMHVCLKKVWTHWEHPKLIHLVLCPLLCLALHLPDIDPPTCRDLPIERQLETVVIDSDLPETLEQADPTPWMARAMNKRPKLLLNAKARKRHGWWLSFDGLDEDSYWSWRWT